MRGNLSCTVWSGGKARGGNTRGLPIAIFTAGRLRQDTVGYAFPWGICKHHLTELGTA